MHITFLALGSRGDVLPCFTLANTLRARGHQIRFATFQNFAPLFSNVNVDFYPIRGDIQKILNDPSGLRFIESGRNPLKMVTAIRKMFGVLSESLAEDIFSPSLFETDLIVNQLPGGLYGYSLAESLSIPMAMVAVIPLTSTRDQPFFPFPSVLSLIPGYNTFTYWLAYQLAWQLFRRVINRWRLSNLSLTKAPLWGFSRKMTQERTPVINGFSQHVVPRPTDWGEHVHITGYWFPPDSHWKPPDDLRKFIEAGPPPIFIGFGSMPMRNPGQITRLVLDAVAKLGCRTIIHSGWGGLGHKDLPSNVHMIEYAPYEWLFPRMAAIVHHGGSGTTGFALRAGIPSLIVPFAFDQFYWGNRIAKLGVGPNPVQYRTLNADRLSAALNIAINDSQMRKRAAKLGAKIGEEDGVTTAVTILEGNFKKM